MSKLKSYLWQLLALTAVAITAIAFSAKISNGDDFFYNPMPRETLRNEQMAIEHLPFVVENFFIVGCRNKTDKVGYKCKFALTESEIIAINENLVKINLLLKECGDFIKQNGCVLPIDPQIRFELFNPYLEKLEKISEMEKIILEIVFLQLGLFETEYGIDDTLKDRDPEFFQYLRDLQSWLYSNFEPPLRTAYDTILAYRQGEELLQIFTSKGFILEGNSNKKGECASFLNKIKEIKNYSFIKPDGTPLTKEEMQKLTADDFRMDNPDKPPKVKWFPLSLNQHDFIACIFRDNPSILIKNEKVIEAYFIGIPEKPLSGIIMENSMNPDITPIEIRWFDENGKKHLMWHPQTIFPLDFFPPASNSIY